MPRRRPFWGKPVVEAVGAMLEEAVEEATETERAVEALEVEAAVLMRM